MRGLALSTVAATWKDDIAQAIESEDFAIAEAKLSESLSIFPEDSELTVLFERVSDRRRAESILRGARVLLATQSMSHEPSAAAAIQALQEVLRRYPGNEEARVRLDELAGHYTALAEGAVTEGDVANAINKLGRASSANPDYPDLARVRELIRQAETLAQEIGEMLQRAGDLRVAAALVDPAGANAAEIYFRVLATDPGNAIAQQGLAEVAEQVLAQFSGFARRPRSLAGATSPRPGRRGGSWRDHRQRDAPAARRGGAAARDGGEPAPRGGGAVPERLLHRAGGTRTWWRSSGR